MDKIYFDVEVYNPEDQCIIQENNVSPQSLTAYIAIMRSGYKVVFNAHE